ncbi:HtaA domain-containing protein [Microbacterium sp. LRZ72]|uniref:HtaA domain-containing protein n=1 Tax=Microbacterium sp. LRZ72 TaxID=2942481 RepID=UPI0029BC2118|nr:HtaA domain-containing protein [Microbacterium sp. LRZ72]MDX2377500.1 HtaA domain-containing protein [Microbacterium sp. LRZ72]
MPKKGRAALHRVLASVLTGTLLAAAALVGVSAPALAADAPSISVGEAPRSGGTVTVVGAGFDPSGFGIYLGVRADGTDADDYTVWIDDEASSEDGETAPMGSDGSFSVDVPVAAYAEGTSYSIVTRAAHGVPNPSQSTTTPIAYEAVPALATTTTLAVAPSGTSTEGEAIELTATVDPAAAGAVTFSDPDAGTIAADVAVVDGVATFAYEDAAVGDYAFSASFAPADTAAFQASSSAAVVHEVTAAPVEPELPTPAVQVSPATDLDAAGATVTVTGEGFVADTPATDATRPPLAGRFGGAYVQFGYELDGTFTAAGRGADLTKWGVHADDLSSIGGADAGGIVIAEDGSFTAEISASAIESAPEGARYGIRTSSGGGAAYAPFTTFTEVTFAEAVADPTLSVSPSTDLDADGATVTVTGENYSTAGTAIYGPSAGQPAGVYAQIGWLTEDWRPSEGAASSARSNAYSVWVQGENETLPYLKWTDNGDGTADFVWEVQIDQATLEAKRLDGAELAVFTVGAGGVVQAENELAQSIAFAEPAAAPAVTVEPSEDLDPNVDNTVTVTGSGFTGAGAANGVYVLFGETSVWSGGSAPPSGGWDAQAWVMPTSLVDGTFTTTLTIPAGTLDPALSYQVATSAAHGLSITDRSMDTFTPVGVADVTLTPAIALSEGTLRAGDDLTVAGTGFTPGDRATITVNSDPITLGSAAVATDGTFSVSGTIPASFPAGTHTVVASVGGVPIASRSLTVTAAATTPSVQPAAQPTCVANAVSGASLEWGVKESFRSYIDGSIANGSFSIAWGGGSGAYSTETDRGRVGYGGAATFTGHDGALDLTISAPRIQVNGSQASLIADVSSKNLDGSTYSRSGIVFATLALPAPTTSSGVLSWSGASATLTAAGAEAFGGFYEAGTALDPVSFAFPLGAEVDCDTTTSGDLASTGGDSPFPAAWLGLGMLLLGVSLVALRRRSLQA